jgi:uncharacterized NAD-dependent epimerase/dehydratase family protein
VGVAINSSSLSLPEWTRYREQLQAELQLPVCDPMRGGVEPIVQTLGA